MPQIQHFKKKNVPVSVRRNIAVSHGCSPGQAVQAFCTYCGAEGKVRWNPCGWVTFDDLEMDHVIPEFHGGSTDEKNLVLSCRTCNRSKGHSKFWKH